MKQLNAGDEGLISWYKPMRWVIEYIYLATAKATECMADS